MSYTCISVNNVNFHCRIRHIHSCVQIHRENTHGAKRDTSRYVFLPDGYNLVIYQSPRAHIPSYSGGEAAHHEPEPIHILLGIFYQRYECTSIYFMLSRTGNIYIFISPLLCLSIPSDRRL